MSEQFLFLINETKIRVIYRSKDKKKKKVKPKKVKSEDKKMKCDRYVYVLQKYDSIDEERALIILTQLTCVTTLKRFVIIPLYDHLW